VSYGCIRMSSCDVLKVYDLVGRGARVEIIDGPLSALSTMSSAF